MAHPSAERQSSAAGGMRAEVLKLKQRISRGRRLLVCSIYLDALSLDDHPMGGRG